MSLDKAIIEFNKSGARLAKYDNSTPDPIVDFETQRYRVLNAYIKLNNGNNLTDKQRIDLTNYVNMYHEYLK